MANTIIEYRVLMTYARNKKFKKTELPEELRNLTFEVLSPGKKANSKKVKAAAEFYATHGINKDSAASLLEDMNIHREEELMRYDEGRGWYTSDPEKLKKRNFERIKKWIWFLIEAKKGEEVIGYICIPKGWVWVSWKWRYGVRWPVVHPGYRGHFVSYFLLLAAMLKLSSMWRVPLRIKTIYALVRSIEGDEKDGEDQGEEDNYVRKLVKPLGKSAVFKTVKMKVRKEKTDKHRVVFIEF